LDSLSVIVQLVRLYNAMTEAGLRSRPDRTHGENVSPGRVPVHRTPGWVKMFGVVAIIAIAMFAALHFVDEGIGHLAHGAMDAHAPSAEHDQHRP